MDTLIYVDPVTGDKTYQSEDYPTASYTVPSQATLDARAASQAIEDAQNQTAQDLENLIQQNIRLMAINDLQSQGLISDDQVTAETAKLSALTTAQASMAKIATTATEV